MKEIKITNVLMSVSNDDPAEFSFYGKAIVYVNSDFTGAVATFYKEKEDDNGCGVSE